MFFKKTIAGITAFTTVAAMSGMTAFADDETTAASENSYKEAKLDTLVYSPDNKQTMDCRYYDSMPNIPYVKLSDYYKLWDVPHILPSTDTPE